jgi:soluble P-type ATPase
VLKNEIYILSGDSAQTVNKIGFFLDVDETKVFAEKNKD